MTRVTLSVYDDIDNPHYAGGGARVVHEVARRLAQVHEVTVYCSSYKGSPRQRIRDGVVYHFVRSGWAGPRGGQVVFGLVLPFIAMSRRFDVWLETFTPPWGVSLLPLVNRQKVVGWAQLLPGKAMSARYHVPFWRLERRGLRWYRRMIVLNEADRDTVLAANPSLRVTVIPNGVNAPKPQLHEELALRPFSLYLGRIDVLTKGLDLLVSAQRRARRPLPLIIAGSGTTGEEFALRALLPADDSIRLVGRVDDADKDFLLSTCSALIMPSRVETFGLVALEAMARGKRVINFALPTLAWLRGSGHREVEPLNVDELAAALDELADPTIAPPNAEAIKAFARRFEWDKTIVGYLRVIDEITRASSRNSARREGVPRHA